MHSDECEYSLLSLMESCLDFANKITELQSMGKEPGVEVMITPKFHADIAGEGIEYAWGVAKSVFSG